MLGPGEILHIHGIKDWTVLVFHVAWLFGDRPLRTEALMKKNERGNRQSSLA